MLKVETKTTEKGFQVIFHINTEKEAIEFHDRVAIAILDKPHEFIGNICNRIEPHEVPKDQYFLI